ncbi:MAG TPA: VWA domain-containing protein [Candidatus Saccharimonadales bacterium]|jgi:Mg-chelatase subunit ChlD
MSKSIGGFDGPPRKDSFAAKVARSDNPDAAVDVSELTENEKTQLRRASEIDKAAASFSFIKPELATERVEIIFDNSGSMEGQEIKDAKEGVTEFMKACTPNETAIRVVPVDSTRSSVTLAFTCDLPAVAMRVQEFKAEGGTPLYSKLLNALGKGNRNDLYPTRIIAFSDGQAGDGYARRQHSYGDIILADSPTHTEMVQLAKQRSVPIDTCYIADRIAADEEHLRHDGAYQTMKAIAEDTGGIFLVFEKGKCDFKRGFKYLTKGNRLFLMDSSFKAKLEAGQI